jgi:hypothetical protein
MDPKTDREGAAVRPASAKNKNFFMEPLKVAGGT